MSSIPQSVPKSAGLRFHLHNILEIRKLWRRIISGGVWVYRGSTRGPGSEEGVLDFTCSGGYRDLHGITLYAHTLK